MSSRKRSRSTGESSAAKRPRYSDLAGALATDRPRIQIPLPMGFSMDVLDMTPGSPDFKGFSAVTAAVKRGRPASFGADKDIILLKYIYEGTSGATFLGKYGEHKEKVAIKIQKDPIATVTKDGFKMMRDGPEHIMDAVRQYDMMRQICDAAGAKPNTSGAPMTKDRLKKLGPVVQPIGVCLARIKNTVHTVVAMEAMDTSLEGFITKVLPSWGFELRDLLLAKLIVVLKALFNIRKLHTLGFDHMDPHMGNWLVTYSGVSSDVWYLDVRMTDLDRTCRYRPTERPDSCLTMSHRGDDPFYNQWLYHGAVEYSQFAYFTVNGILEDIIQYLPDPIIHYWNALQKDLAVLHKAHFKHVLETVYPKSHLIDDPFEMWFRNPAGVSVQGLLVEILKLQEPAVIKRLISEGLIPRDWATDW